MAYCGRCGNQVADGTAFCPKCGQPVAAAPHAGGAMASPAPVAGAQSGLSENAAGALSYILGWVTGIIFFLIDKRPYVRFHAAQSIVTFGGLHIILIALGMIFGFGFGFGGFGLGGFGAAIMIYWLIDLVAFILWILLMIKASQGQKFMVPIAGGIAQNLAGKQI